ncbi:helix-turn-helix domain-containing protein [Listeria booriae]|nr:helix-turn-helix domain-containing protein [Listeria booriae]
MNKINQGRAVLILYAVIVVASQGDVEAIQSVLSHLIG